MDSPEIAVGRTVLARNAIPFRCAQEIVDEMANRECEEIVEKVFDDLVPGAETNIDCYTKHAKHYEKGLEGIKYCVPQWCAKKTLAHVNTGSEKMQVLDICVGTGLTSKALVDNGFKGDIDGIDGNQAMLDEARSKGIFRDLIQQIITPEEGLPFHDQTYDIVVCTGSFSAGHIRAECLPDFFRVLKVGGTFAFNTTNFNINDDCASDVDLNKADQVMENLIASGVCELKESTVTGSMANISNDFKYRKGNTDKIRCYRKLQSEVLPRQKAA